MFSLIKPTNPLSYPPDKDLRVEPIPVFQTRRKVNLITGNIITFCEPFNNKKFDITLNVSTFIVPIQRTFFSLKRYLR